MTRERDTRRDGGCPDVPSKSQRKREAHALEDLGRKLVESSEARVNRMDLPDEVRNAILEARGIHAHGARRRQIRYIGRLLRQLNLDPNIALEGRTSTRVSEKLVYWHARLNREGNGALSDFFVQYPGADRQRVRQAVRAARTVEPDTSSSEQASKARMLRHVLAQYIDD